MFIIDRKMKKSTFIKLVTMAKRIYGWMLLCICWISLMVLCAPAFLVFSVGKDGELTIWNVVGLLWCGGLYWLFKKKINP